MGNPLGIVLLHESGPCAPARVASLDGEPARDRAAARERPLRPGASCPARLEGINGMAMTGVHWTVDGGSELRRRRDSLLTHCRRTDPNESCPSAGRPPHSLAERSSLKLALSRGDSAQHREFLGWVARYSVGRSGAMALLPLRFSQMVAWPMSVGSLDGVGMILKRRRPIRLASWLMVLSLAVANAASAADAAVDGDLEKQNAAVDGDLEKQSAAVDSVWTDKSATNESPVAQGGHSAQVAPVEIQWPIAEFTAAVYPPGAVGDAEVVLELQIDESGSVREAKAVSGSAPFTTEAERAASAWRFRAARVAGRATPVRVKFLVRFFAPPPAAEQVEPPNSIASDAAPPHAAERAAAAPIQARVQTEVIEVTVRGQNRGEISEGFGSAEVEQIPGGFGDPFRAIEVLPGVTPIASGLPFFFIRGAPPGNQGFYLDGIRVPTLYHMALGPGVVHPALIERVDLYAGGYPARYGRFAGGIVAAQTREPATEWHGQGSVRAVDAGGFVSGPLGNGTVAAGGRYSYTALILSLLVPDLDLEYWDYQVRVSNDISSKSRVTAFVFGSYDGLRSSASEETITQNSTEFHRVDVRYDHQLASTTHFQVAATYGYDRSRGTADQFTLTDHMVDGRVSIEHELGTAATLRSGADVETDSYGVEAFYDGKFDANLQATIHPRRDWVYGVWTDIVLRPTRRITVVPGIRGDMYTSASRGAIGVDPRLSATFEITDHWRLKHAFGVAHQPPSFFVTIPGVAVDALAEGLQRSVQYSAGTEHDLPEGFHFSLTGFEHAFFNASDQASLVSLEQSPKLEARTRGQAAGIEVMLRRDLTRRFGGVVAYTLSHSWRSYELTRAPAAFDRTHVLHVAGSYDLGRNWRAGSRFTLYTGVPASARDDTLNLVSSVRGGMPRTPTFWRIDAKLQKRWPLGSTGQYAALAFEVLNATLNREIVRSECSAFDCKDWEIGPVTLPSVGFEAGF